MVVFFLSLKQIKREARVVGRCAFLKKSHAEKGLFSVRAFELKPALQTEVLLFVREKKKIKTHSFLFLQGGA